MGLIYNISLFSLSLYSLSKVCLFFLVMSPPAPPTSSTYPLPYFKADLPAPFSGDGSENFTLWCRRLEVAVHANSHFHQAQLSAIKLSGAAFTFWDSLSPNVKADYDKV